MKHEILGMPADVVLRVPSVKLLGDSLTEVNNHKGLREYDSKVIKIITNIGDLYVEGRNLDIKEITNEYIRIEGKITKIAYNGGSDCGR